MAPRSLNISGRSYSAYFRWNEGLFVMLRSADGEVAKDVQRRAYAVQKRAKRAAGYRYGTLRRGIKVESVRESPEGPYSKVISTAKHTMVNEYGRKAVKPVMGTYDYALKFQPKRGMRKIYRFSAGPAKGTHFMERSIDGFAAD